MRNKRQLAAAFVVAAVLSVGMPVYADMGGQTRSTCAFLTGLEQTGMPTFVVTILGQLFGCWAE